MQAISRNFVAFLLLLSGFASGVSSAKPEVFELDPKFKSGCDANVLAQSISPDGDFKVIAFNYDCGATTGFVTNLTIVEVGDNRPKDPHHTFMSMDAKGSGDDPAPNIETYRFGGPKVKIRWLTSSSFEVQYPAKARVIQSRNRFDGFTIRYVRL